MVELYVRKKSHLLSIIEKYNYDTTFMNYLKSLDYDFFVDNVLILNISDNYIVDMSIKSQQTERVELFGDKKNRFIKKGILPEDNCHLVLTQKEINLANL